MVCCAYEVMLESKRFCQALVGDNEPIGFTPRSCVWIALETPTWAPVAGSSARRLPPANATKSWFCEGSSGGCPSHWSPSIPMNENSATAGDLTVNPEIVSGPLRAPVRALGTPDVPQPVLGSVFSGMPGPKFGHKDSSQVSSNRMNPLKRLMLRTFG